MTSGAGQATSNERKRQKLPALLPPARDADGMAKPLAKLIALIKSKRRWAQFSLATL